nr:MAG TPA: hypothetical protein [Caudoviricetes sp.]
MRPGIICVRNQVINRSVENFEFRFFHSVKKVRPACFSRAHSNQPQGDSLLRRFSPPFSSGELEIQRSEHLPVGNLGLLDVVNGSVLKPTERLCGLSINVEGNNGTAENVGRPLVL